MKRDRDDDKKQKDDEAQINKDKRCIKHMIDEKLFEYVRESDLDKFNSNQFQNLQDQTSLEINTNSVYTCCTQASDPAAIYVGWDGYVKLWVKNSIINYGVRTTGFPSYNHALYAAAQLRAACDEWNTKSIGVQFRFVSNFNDMCFALAYGGNLGTVYARAFPPTSVDISFLYVYSYSFASNAINYMRHIFTHEVGHIIGLRHEFAMQEGGAVLYGSTNPLSVMSYNFPPRIQSTDVSSTRSLYNYTGQSVGGMRIVKYTPNN